MPSSMGFDSRRHANRRGILAMTFGMLCFMLNDALVKFVSQTMPTAQLIFLRGAMATLLVLAVAHALGATAQLSMAVRPRVLLRACVDSCATLLYLVSLFHLPLPNATAINLATPLVMMLFAICFLGEKPGWSRWVAIGLGFAGVLLVVQPQAEGFNVYALVCVAGTLFHAARDLMTRTIDRRIPSVLITLATTCTVTVISGALSLVQGWQPFGGTSLGLLALASALLAGAYYLIILCMREGEMSVTAPFRYSALLYSLVLGYLIWGDVPNLLAWCGIALLVGAGLYALYSERSNARASAQRALEAQTD